MFGQMRIAILDYKVLPSNPAGGCHWRLLRALCKEHEFTVFSLEFDNPDPRRIDWVRIPAVPRPLAALFVTFHLLAPICFFLYCRRNRIRFDLVQMVESNVGFGDIAYAHFCHRYYLRNYWRIAKPSGLRGLFRRLDHQLHAIGERFVFRRVRRLIVPSLGLANEIEREFPYTAGRMEVIPNPIELDRMNRPAAFDREAFRSALGISGEDVVLVFAALGHFERKGLPALLEAMASPGCEPVKLIVAGGTPGTIVAYRGKTNHLGLGRRVFFVGTQDDVRPYFWSADAFVLPSAYETFSLVTYEAAAAGLPLIVARTNGIEEILRDGKNGILIGTTPASICSGLERFLCLQSGDRRRMGESSKESVRGYCSENFTARWRALYASEDLTGPQRLDLAPVQSG